MMSRAARDRGCWGGNERAGLHYESRVLLFHPGPSLESVCLQVFANEGQDTYTPQQAVARGQWVSGRRRSPKRRSLVWLGGGVTATFCSPRAVGRSSGPGVQLDGLGSWRAESSGGPILSQGRFPPHRHLPLPRGGHRRAGRVSWRHGRPSRRLSKAQCHRRSFRPSAVAVEDSNSDIFVPPLPFISRGRGRMLMSVFLDFLRVFVAAAVLTFSFFEASCSQTRKQPVCLAREGPRGPVNHGRPSSIRQVVALLGLHDFTNRLLHPSRAQRLGSFSDFLFSSLPLLFPFRAFTSRLMTSRGRSTRSGSFFPFLPFSFPVVGTALASRHANRGAMRPSAGLSATRKAAR